jgi:hypothetical protein
MPRRVNASKEKIVTERSDLASNLNRIRDDYRGAIRRSWDKVVRDLALLMETYGVDAVRKIKMPLTPLTPTGTRKVFGQPGLLCLNDWMWIFVQAQKIVIKHQELREKKDRSRKNKKR